MNLYEPCFAAQFHCLAGACPDTCCKDWEIILDEKTLARYRALPGVFGDEVRACLTTDAEGDTMFRLTDGHCPLLSSDGLCRVQLSLGAVSYTHLTLPTNREVEIWMVAAAVKHKQEGRKGEVN